MGLTSDEASLVVISFIYSESNETAWHGGRSERIQLPRFVVRVSFPVPYFSADGDPPDDAGLGQGDRDLGGQVRGPQDRQGLSSTGDKLMRFIAG